MVFQMSVIGTAIYAGFTANTGTKDTFPGNEQALRKDREESLLKTKRVTDANRDCRSSFPAVAIGTLHPGVQFLQVGHLHVRTVPNDFFVCAGLHRQVA